MYTSMTLKNKKETLLGRKCLTFFIGKVANFGKLRSQNRPIEMDSRGKYNSHSI